MRKIYTMERSSTDMSTIAENIANIRAQMADAAKKAGRDPSEILLCAATKMNDADEILDLIGLQMADEMQGLSRVRAQRALGLNFLHAVFATAIDACGDCLLDTVGVVHLR